MLILTNCLVDEPDEGALNVAANLIGRILAEDPGAEVISYDRVNSLAHRHLKLNKLLLNVSLFRCLGRRGEPLLYLPFPARSVPTALRIFVLSRMHRGKLRVLLPMTHPLNAFAGSLLRHSGAEVAVLSRDAWNQYRVFLTEDRVIRLRAAVDTEKFRPVTPEKVRELKRKYGLDPDRPVALHVGHLKSGRNIRTLKNIPKTWQVLLVVSTHTRDTQEETLREELIHAGNIRILDDYIPEIREIYQLSDVYFFPVVRPGNCIDIPLSCLEAAACGKPVVTTVYGQMKDFAGTPGFFLLDDPEQNLDAIFAEALSAQPGISRRAAEVYDWKTAGKLLADWGRHHG